MVKQLRRRGGQVIEAVRWTGQNTIEVMDFCNGNEPPRPGRGGWFLGLDQLMVATPNGGVPVNPGEWVARGIKGELYPLDDDVRCQLYDEIDAPGDPVALREEVARLRGKEAMRRLNRAHNRTLRHLRRLSEQHQELRGLAGDVTEAATTGDQILARIRLRDWLADHRRKPQGPQVAQPPRPVEIVGDIPAFVTPEGVHLHRETGAGAGAPLDPVSATPPLTGEMPE